MTLSSAIHDVGHPGVPNPFLVASGDELAIRYNDKSVLENFHIATAFQIMKKSGVDLLGKLGGDARLLRKDIIEIVLATDMAFRADSIAECERMAEAGGIDWSVPSAQTAIAKSAVHACDIETWHALGMFIGNGKTASWKRYSTRPKKKGL